jgi:hypothetical protein
MKTSEYKIGRFTVTRTGNEVTMKPGFLKIKSTTTGQWIYNAECVVKTLDAGAAEFEFKRFCKIAKQEHTINLWERLNKAPEAIYLRFQRLFARQNSGKWIRGININGGTVSLNLE